MPKLYVKRGNDPEFEVSDRVSGLKFLEDTNDPQFLPTYQQNIGQDGQQLTGSNYDKNIINSNFLLKFHSWTDFINAKHEVYKMFPARKVIRLRTDVEPNKAKYVTPTPFEIKPTEDGANDSLFTIPFDNPSGFKFSIARSDEIKDFESSNWSYDMNLPVDRDLSYTHTESNFEIFNASDIEIDPYFQNHDLKILVNFSGQSLEIVNKTNGSSWKYLKPANKSDNIVLNGITTYLNGESASVNTDFGNLTLDVGNNGISVNGATDFEITFSFPFIYI